MAIFSSTPTSKSNISLMHGIKPADNLIDNSGHTLLSNATLELRTPMTIRIRHLYLAGEKANQNLGGADNVGVADSKDDQIYPT